MKTFLDGLDRDIQENLKQQLWVLWTHSSTALEGNTLSIGETDFVIREGLTVSGKPLKDHLEVKNHYAAIKVIYQLLNESPLTEKQLFDLHKVVANENIVDIYKPVGAWKVEPNGTYKYENDKSVWVEYPSPDKIPGIMKQWLELYNRQSVPQSKAEAVKVYSLLHTTLASIHPFYDGNGRMARLVANMPVIKAGLPPIIIDSTRRQEYIQIMQHYALNDYSLLELNNDLAEFESFCSSCWENVYELVRSAHELQAKRKQ